MRCEPIIGYLHTGMEKECEDQNWRGAVTIVTRMDYLAQFFNEQAYSLAVEELLGVEVPPRGKYIRTLMTEINRMSSHLVWFGTQGLDMGAMSAMFYGFREREMILDFYEMVTGLRMNNGYIIPGGVWEDLPDGWEEAVDAIASVAARPHRRVRGAALPRTRSSSSAPAVSASSPRTRRSRWARPVRSPARPASTGTFAATCRTTRTGT